MNTIHNSLNLTRNNPRKWCSWYILSIAPLPNADKEGIWK